MGIDAVFCEREGGAWVAGKAARHVADFDGFLNMAFLFGQTLAGLRELAPQMPQLPGTPDIMGAMTCFEAYLADSPEPAVACFQVFYGAIAEAHYRMLLQTAPGEPRRWGGIVEQVTLDDFPADVQAFFGRFMLGEATIEPDQARIVTPVLGLMLSLMESFADKYRPENPALADRLIAARASLDVARDFCDQAIIMDQPFRFVVDLSQG